MAKAIVTPRDRGYRMPAEWGPHEATWLAWPHMRFAKYWGDRLQGVEDIYAQMISALAESEKVNLLVVDAWMEVDVRKKLEKAKVGLDHVVFYAIPTLDVWMRDYGPLFVVDKERSVAITHWVFNGWGKFPDLVQDTSIPAKIHEHLVVPSFHAGLVLEGGSIEVNGAGTLITTRQCLLNKNRNPHVPQSMIEERLRDYLGVYDIVWLNKGIAGDDTDGHVDNLVRFVDVRKAVCVYERNGADQNCRALLENRRVLEESGMLDELVALPTPGCLKADRRRLPASYANFYIANNVVLAPIFGKENDDEAVGILRELFPTRKVVPINCMDLIPSGGTIHCVTQQQPKGCRQAERHEPAGI